MYYTMLYYTTGDQYQSRCGLFLSTRLSAGPVSRTHTHWYRYRWGRRGRRSGRDGARIRYRATVQGEVRIMTILLFIIRI